MSERAARRAPSLDAILSITPSAIEAFTTCPRRYALQYLEGLPPSDGGPSNTHGLVAHDLLHRIHLRGSCHDATVVDEVLRELDQDTDVNRSLIERHARRCPADAEFAFHEQTFVRFLRVQPMFLASARYDAIWVRGNVVDVREYKTGAQWYHQIDEDPRAMLQAWILAARVARRGRVLRLRYEYLSPEIDEDPDVWEPSDDDLTAIGARIHDIVRSMHASDWIGVAEEPTCRWCRYRSVCRDSVARAEPIWAALGVGQ
jgi:RecB family exonuclease